VISLFLRLFMEICQNSPSSDTIIEFMADGSWKPSTETSGETSGALYCTSYVACTVYNPV
jgi:hypothetical protein